MSIPIAPPEPSLYVRKQFDRYRDELRKRGMQVNQVLLAFEQFIATKADLAMVSEGIDEPTRKRVINRILHGTAEQSIPERKPE
jgi:hypothetical protein